jgi:hypothetical protein
MKYVLQSEIPAYYGEEYFIFQEFKFVCVETFQVASHKKSNASLTGRKVGERGISFV